MEFITRFISVEYLQMLIRFFICFATNWVIVAQLYYPKSKRRDFYFTFMLISVAIFFIVFFMVFVLDNMKGKTSMGIGIGLFGIFSIMRYRTDAMPVREMTYLFVIIALALVNSIADGVSIIELLLTNLIIIAFVAVLERNLKLESSKLIQYDRIELITPDRRDELKADLEKRLGVKIIKLDVGAVDFIRDMAMVKIIYKGKQVDKEISESVKLSKSQLSSSFFL